MLDKVKTHFGVCMRLYAVLDITSPLPSPTCN